MAFICINCSICNESFASSALDGMSPFELVFVRRALDITKLKIQEIGNVARPIKKYHNLLKERAKLIDATYLNWKTAKALSVQGKNQNYKDLGIFNTDDLVCILISTTCIISSNWHNKISIRFYWSPCHWQEVRPNPLYIAQPHRLKTTRHLPHKQIKAC